MCGNWKLNLFKALESLKSKDKECVLLIEGDRKQVNCFGSRIFDSDERTTSALLALLINNDSPAFKHYVTENYPD